VIQQHSWQLTRVGLGDNDALEAVVGLQSRLTLDRQQLTKDVIKSKTGFLISSYTVDDFKKFIASDGGLFAARHSSGITVGYLLHQTGNHFVKHRPQTRIYWNTELDKQAFENNFQAGSFCYLDQIGVDLEYHGKGVATALSNALENAFPDQPILSAVMQKPIYNERSHAFFVKDGFIRIGRFFSPHLKGIDNVESTVFVKNIKKGTHL
jgi:ribosomal protein S18 acetylase RimI-like enzyme